VSNRNQDAREIERRLLELAHTTDAKITVPALAYYASCSLDDASRVLDDLATRDRLSMEVEDDGTIVYEMPGRQKLQALRGVVPPPALPSRSRALVPMIERSRDARPLVAAALSLCIPGAGHLYAGRVLAAFLWFAVVSAGYALVLPGLVLHLFSIASAAAAARRQAPFARLQLAAPTMF
jgi:hypothetical protein